MNAIPPSFAGPQRRRRKLGEIVAERIVADIVHRGWPEGEMLGTEADFMDRYRVSRATFREAMRQLEWHGAAAMRRGASGGLVVMAPPRDAVVLAIRTFFRLGKVGPEARAECARVLREARRLGDAREPNQAIALFLEALDLTQPAAAPAAPKLGETVAQQIIAAIDGGGLAAGTSLGSEEEVRRRQGVSRAVLREALRWLELHDIVRVRTGARGGIIVHGIDSDYTIDLASTWLQYARIPLTHFWEAHAALAEAAIGWFARRAGPAELDALRRAQDRLERAGASHYLVAANAFHAIVADHCGNRAAGLFLRILLKHAPEALPRPDARFLPMIKAAHARLRDAIAAGRTGNAVSEFHAIFEHSRRWLERAEATRRTGQ